jgi:NAD(P)-dependent dehydrogenase (short-subunit alcohol dehydrogenase family)
MAIPFLAKTNGNVVNVSAAAAQRASNSMYFYSMTKAALDQYTRSAALLYACKGIRINSVSPGITESSFVSRHSALKAIAERAGKAFVSIVPLGRRAKAREIADAILFVASDRASYITATIVPVDGGILAGFPMPSESNV